MARSRLSKMEKERVWTRVEETLGPMTPVRKRRRDWRETKDGRTSVFVTFSKLDHLFYDVNPSDLQEWLSYAQASIVLVMGRHTEVLVIPVQELQRLIKGLQPKGYGEVKLHIAHTPRGYIFREVPESDLTCFYNAYSLLEATIGETGRGFKRNEMVVEKASTQQIEAMYVSPEELERRLRHHNQVGLVGELVAYRYEVERLAHLGIEQPEQWVDHVSKRNAAAGFDIQSGSPCTKTRYIEVKASAQTPESFYITRNEIKFLREKADQAYLYLVLITNLQKGQGSVVREVQKPIEVIESSGALEPVLFRARLGREEAICG